MGDTPKPAPSVEDQAVLREQFRLLSRHAPTIYLGTFVVSILLVIALFRRVDSAILIIWASLIWLLTTIRFAIAHGASGRDPQFQSTRFWRLFFVLGSGLSGALWGASGVLFFAANDPLLIAFVLIILSGMTAGSVASLSSYGPAYVAYAGPTMLPISISLLAETSETHVILGIAAIVFLIVNLTYSRNIQTMVRESIQLRFENLDLLETLAEQRARAEIARDDAERANKTKSQFLAAASHDLRQPVHALGLLLNAAAETDDDAERANLFVKIESSTSALKDLFDALLDISKLDAGVVDVETVDFRLQEITSRLEEEARAPAAEKGIEVSFHNTDVVLRSDPFLLERILRNLLSNAVKFSPKGRVRLDAQNVNDTIELSVTDTGPGILPEHHKIIFLEFEQLDNPERDRRKGLGLGLAIVDRLCHLLGVPLEVMSTVGVGSTFRLRVRKGEETNLTSQIEEDRQPAWDIADCRVLVVEDEADVADATVTILNTWGCDVSCVRTSAEALQHIRGNVAPPEIILADYRLRGDMTGADLIQRIRQDANIDIPALILTGDTAKDRLAEAVGSGIFLLHKPVNPAELRVAINKALMAKTRHIVQ